MLIDGKAIADAIQDEIGAYIRTITGRKPGLAVLIVGENPASQIYVKKKVQTCEALGIHSKLIKLPIQISENELLSEISHLNENPDIDGILVQLPLPSHIQAQKILYAIDPAKDVDGFHPLNMGKLLIGDMEGYVPCTPLGIQTLLIRSGVRIEGKHVLIFGRSNIVGKPLAALLMQQREGGNATVTIAHSRSENLSELCQSADIVVSAVGKPEIITAPMIKEGAVVIDVGVNRVENPESKTGYRIVGDVDFKNVQQKCSLITPVPGGVGPMTIAMLMSNTLKSYKLRVGL